MPSIDLSILNQRQTPAFYADTLANRPAFGFLGRIFVSTDTLDLYRDTGSAWVLLSPSSTGTVTGTGATGQVTYWASSGSITGSNDLFFDAVNGHLGINTITPGTALDVKHDQNTVVQLEQVTATNDNRIAFINNGVGLWRIGSFYNAGANDFGLFDIAAATQPVTVKRTTGQVLIGTSTVGSGKLVVASATGDNGVQIVGASAPSLRIDNAASGPTKRAGFGISTATNNFIQGSADRDFCMFNGSTTASPILFGIYDAGAVNVQEAARISPARNFLIGTTTDAGFKLDVNGAARVTGIVYADNTIRVGNAIIGTNSNNLLLSSNTTGGEIGFYNNQLGNRLMTLLGNGNLLLGSSNTDLGYRLQITATTTTGFLFQSSASASGINLKNTGGTPSDWIIQSDGGAVPGQAALRFYSQTASAYRMSIDGSGNVGIGIDTIASVNRLQVNTSTDINLGIRAAVNTTGAVCIQAVNDAASSNIPLEIRGSKTCFTTGNVLIGTSTDAGQKLQVSGTAIITGNTTIGAATAATNLEFNLNGVSGKALRIQFQNNGTNQWLLGAGAASETSAFELFNASGTIVISVDKTTNVTTINAPIAIGNSVSAAVAAPSTHKVSILINGVQYYLLASNV